MDFLTTKKTPSMSVLKLMQRMGLENALKNIITGRIMLIFDKTVLTTRINLYVL